MTLGPHKLLADTLLALNHIRNQRVNRDRKSTATTYDLAGNIEEYLRSKGVEVYSTGWVEKAEALDGYKLGPVEMLTVQLGDFHVAQLEEGAGLLRP